MSNKGVDRRDADGAAAAKCVQDQKPRQYVIAAGHSRNDEPRRNVDAGANHFQEDEPPRGVSAAGEDDELYGGEDAHDFGRDGENGEAVQNANDEFGNSENDEHRRAGVDVRGHNHNDEIPRGAAAGRDHDADNDENQDPNIKNSLVSDKPEEGKLQLTRGIHIYVDATELNYMKMKWRAKPAELTRRLVKLIVGKDKLREMTPTGRANTSSIPQAVYKAVFIYVNKKLPEGEDKLQESNYRRILTNMCNTLRNPKKSR
ncbi:uncharacterized protein LOC116416419 [Nasonia vitripennis]|uniref:BEN domain-containing protein n=1 Tax=Nasonia vitripennis TaxID=7425 RepID=A0A7M7Q732_NASVI|nr:uncharacterized protein LOC116416419 [Nasonia vitripennis]